MADYMSEEEQSPHPLPPTHTHPVLNKRKKASEHQWIDSDVRV